MIMKNIVFWYVAPDPQGATSQKTIFFKEVSLHFGAVGPSWEACLIKGDLLMCIFKIVSESLEIISVHLF
jgi:hypothetical protein